MMKGMMSMMKKGGAGKGLDNWGKDSGKGKGKGKWNDSGKGKGKKKKFPSGPDLERTRLTEEAVTGEVLEWKGKYGWIKPTEELDHPMASRREGRVWVSCSDLQGVEELTAGTVCQFHVYCDSS